LPAEPFTISHFGAWSRRCVLDNGEECRLNDFQFEFVEDLFDGTPEAHLVIPEGNGKTTLVALLALYGLRFAPDALIPVAASSRDQARIMYRQAKGFLRRSRLDDPGVEFHAFDGYRRIDIRLPGRTKRGDVGGSIEIHAADAGTGDGIIPYPYAFLDELHRHKTLELYRTWGGKLDKRQAQLVIISTAGEPGGDFEETRERIRQETPVLVSMPGFTKCRSDRILFHEYALEEGGDPEDMEAVKRCNPLPSITVEGLAAKHGSPTMTPQHWSRFVCNLPTRGGHAAIAEADWLRQRSDEEIPEGAPVWVGLDVGWSWDTTAIVPLWVRDAEFRLLGAPTILVPPRDGTMLDGRKIERALEEIHERNPIIAVVMDPHDAEPQAQWIDRELGVDVIVRTQSIPGKVEEYDSFTSALREGWLFHTGDRGLTRHVMNAVVQVLPRGDARFARVSKTRQGGNQDMRVIDALDAAAMVHVAATSAQPAGEIMVAFA